MKVTCHRLGGQFYFIPRPNLTVLGIAGDCLELDTGDAHGLGMVMCSINKSQSLITLEPYDDHPQAVSWVFHPLAVPEHAWFQVRHNLMPVLKPCSPTEYTVAGDLALLATEGELYCFDTGNVNAGAIGEYLKEHKPYVPADLPKKLVDATICSALEVGMATVPAGDAFHAWVNIFRSALVFARLFPHLAEYAVGPKESAGHPLYGEGAEISIWREMLEALDATVAEHPEQMYEIAAEAADTVANLAPDLKEMLRGINLDPDTPAAE